MQGLKLIKQIWKSRNTILKALYNKLFKPYSDIQISRISKCRKCPFNTKNKNKEFYISGEYENLPYQACNQCGCSIYLKIFSEWYNYPNPQYNPCPKKKWTK